MRDSFEDRFWQCVDRRGADECWPWLCAKIGGGYGQMWWPAYKRPIPSHRIAYVLANGVIPEGMLVMHSCDETGCCNPYHLILGTSRANSYDMAAKGRHGQTKLTPAIVRAIRVASQAGVTHAELAAEYSVSWPCISDVVRGRTWRHVTP